MYKILFILNILLANFIYINNSSLIDLVKENKFVLVFNRHNENKKELWQYYLLKYKIIKNYYFNLKNIINFAIKDGKEDFDISLFINGNRYNYHGNINHIDLFDYYRNFIYRNYDTIYLKSLLQDKKKYKHFVVEFNEQSLNHKSKNLNDILEILAAEFMNLVHVIFVKTRLYDVKHNPNAENKVIEECKDICIHTRSKINNYNGHFDIQHLRNFILYEYIIYENFYINHSILHYFEKNKFKFYLIDNTYHNLKEIYNKNYFKNKFIFYFPKNLNDFKILENLDKTKIYELYYIKNQFIINILDKSLKLIIN